MRVCRKKDKLCERGKPEVRAASAIHAIARMNFLYDRKSPNHIEFDNLCDHFGTKKATVGNEATQIESIPKASPRGGPSLARRDLLEVFTILRPPEGPAYSFKEAKKLGYLPPRHTGRGFLATTITTQLAKFRRYTDDKNTLQADS